MLKPIYIYKFKFSIDKVKSYSKYFIVDNKNLNKLDKFIYLIQFHNYDQLFINLKVNKEYEIVNNIDDTKSIEYWCSDINCVNNFSLIEFYDLIYLLKNMIAENNSRKSWSTAPKLVELLQLILAKYKDWY
jgi:hypothetical protein